MGIDLHINFSHEKLEFCTLKSEVLCCVDKLQETWDEKRKLVEEVNSETLVARPMNKCFQVSANTSESLTVKVRKWDGRHDRRMDELPLYVAIGNRE